MLSFLSQKRLKFITISAPLLLKRMDTYKGNLFSVTYVSKASSLDPRAHTQSQLVHFAISLLLTSASL